MKGIQGYDTTAPESTLRVIKINPQTDPRWEALVADLPDGLIYHHPSWLRVLEEAYNFKSAHLACEDSDGHLRGILPLFSLRRLFTGRRFISLPRTPMAGPLACDDRAKALLVQAAIDRTRDEPGLHLELKVLSNSLDGLADGVVGVPWLETYLLKLPERPDLLHFGTSRNHSRIRWAVNKATRLGVHVRPAETERDLRAWYELHLNTMSRLSLLPWPYDFFKIAWEHLQPRGLMRLLLAEYREAGKIKLLAGSFFLLFGRTFSYTFTGWQREELSSHANDAIHWHAIHDACAEGFRCYDFGGVSHSNQGLADFKSKWGAESHWLYRYCYPAPASGELANSSRESRLRELAGVTFQRLPSRAAALFSSVIHRSF